MDDQRKPDGGEEESTSNPNKNKTPSKKDVRVINLPETAGPSSGNINLPGAIVPPPKSLHKPGLSKSEQNLSQISVKDLSAALKLTSASYATNNPVIKNLNLKDLKMPIEKADQSKEETTFIDLKKFMASCFKFSREQPTVVSEVPVQSVQATIPSVERIQEAASSNIAPIQTAGVPTHLKPNQVIVTVPNQPPSSEEKDRVSKRDSNEKKKSPSGISERSDLALGPRDSLSSIGSNVCRICMTRGRERLISPCNCKGSLANVHLTCLERWLNQVGRNHCELCGYSYPAIRTPRYTVLQALRLWFGNPRNRSHLQSDCLIFWLLSTVTAGLLAVCIVGTQYFVIEGNKFGKLDRGLRKDEGISHRITETAMDFFMAIVLCGYSVTVYLLWKDHYVMWNRWRRANVNVRLLLSPDSNPVPFVPRPRYNVV